MHVGRSAVWLCHCNLCCSLAILAELIVVMWKITLFNVLVQSAIFPSCVLQNIEHNFHYYERENARNH